MSENNRLQEAKRLEEELLELISQESEDHSEYLVGLYRFMAKVDAMELALIKKGVLTREEIEKEKPTILRAMKKDFLGTK